jgi:hypothetical protein
MPEETGENRHEPGETNEIWAVKTPIFVAKNGCNGSEMR